MKRTMLILAVLVIAAMIAAPVSGATLVQESLKGDSGANITYGGAYSSAGWSPVAWNDALIWHVSGPLAQGSVEFRVKGMTVQTSSEGKSLLSVHDRDYLNSNSQNWYDGWRTAPNKLHLRLDSSRPIGSLRHAHETNSNNPAAETTAANAGTTGNVTSAVLDWDPNVTYTIRYEWSSTGGAGGDGWSRTLRNGVEVVRVDGPSAWPTSGMDLQPLSSMENRFSVRIAHQGRQYDSAPIGATFSDLWVQNVVPEPSSLMALGVFGAGALGMIRRRIR